jgi:hypothetical protein
MVDTLEDILEDRPIFFEDSYVGIIDMSFAIRIG